MYVLSINYVIKVSNYFKKTKREIAAVCTFDVLCCPYSRDWRARTETQMASR